MERGDSMESEWKKGAANMRDTIIAHIIGRQDALGNDENDKGYQELQQLLETIEEQYGTMYGKYLG